MLAEFSVVPVGEGKSLSKDVARFVEFAEESGLDYRLGPMGTVVEGDWDEVMALIKKCHDSAKGGTGRALTRIAVDDSEGATGRITGKVASVEEKLGREVKK